MGSGTTYRPWLTRERCVLGGTLVLGAFILLRSGERGGASDDPVDRCDLHTYARPASVEELDLKRCGLTSLPPVIRRFRSLRKLDVGGNSLSTLPPLPPTVQVLFCLGNRFESIPTAVNRLPYLRMLSFKSNKLAELGAHTRLPASLVWLILTDNQLTALPDGLGLQLPHMRKLMLANNRLASLPESLGRMRELELLRIANNRLAQLPPWLLDGSLPRLAWLALAGNPAVADAPPRGALEAIRPEDIALHETLGEGTSGVVRRGEWRGSTVAVKEYKAQLSSDGRNIDEVRASCALDHPAVLKWLGFYHDEAPWRLGGVLEWAPGFGALGKPPSLDSVTRDTYADGTSFGGAAVRRVAASIAAALAHAHSRGVAHGDLYAHNILFRRETGDAKLSDFGAAFYYGAGAAHSVAWHSIA
jgi:hypothetical protein